MAYEDVPLAYINIHQGATYSEAWNLTDELGEALTASNGWTGRCQIRSDFGGTLIATFADTGADGTITFDEQGNVTLNLPATFTETMESTFNGTSRNSTLFLGDLEVWQTSAPTVKWRALDLRVRVYPEVTTS